jgi:acetyl-CoA carboxylase biotin carboxyl carrier protein
MAFEITVPMAGKIVSIQVEPGTSVDENDTIATLEALKMEIPILTKRSGIVKEIKVEPGDDVDADAVIAIID